MWRRAWGRSGPPSAGPPSAGQASARRRPSPDRPTAVSGFSAGRAWALSPRPARGQGPSGRRPASLRGFPCPSYSRMTGGWFARSVRADLHSPPTLAFLRWTSPPHRCQVRFQEVYTWSPWPIYAHKSFGSFRLRENDFFSVHLFVKKPFLNWSPLFLSQIEVAFSFEIRKTREFCQ